MQLTIAEMIYSIEVAQVSQRKGREFLQSPISFQSPISIQFICTLTILP
jgi:hypothetical protein